MKTKKAAISATTAKKAPKGTAAATTAKPRKTAKPKAKAESGKGKVKVIFTNDKGESLGRIFLPPSTLAKLNKAAEAKGIDPGKMLVQFMDDEIRDNEVLARIESEAMAGDRVKHIAEETGITRATVHSMCLAAGTHAMVRAMEDGPGIRVPFVLHQLTPEPPEGTAPVWCDKEAVGLLRELSRAADIDPDEWVSNWLEGQVSDTIEATKIRSGEPPLFEGAAADWLHGYTFIPALWRKSEKALVSIIERERAKDGAEPGDEFVSVEVPEEIHGEIEALADQAGMTSTAFLSGVVSRNVQAVQGWLDREGKTKGQLGPEDIARMASDLGLPMPPVTIAASLGGLLTDDDAKALEAEAAEQGVTTDEAMVNLLKLGLQAKKERGTVSLRLEFTADQWATLNKKARLEMLQTAEAGAYIRSFIEAMTFDDYSLPLLLPAKTVMRLSDAGVAADLDGYHEAIATAVLGSMAEDADALCSFVLETFDVAPKNRIAVKSLAKRWAREDAKEKGGKGV